MICTLDCYTSSRALTFPRESVFSPQGCSSLSCVTIAIPAYSAFRKRSMGLDEIIGKLICFAEDNISNTTVNYHCNLRLRHFDNSITRNPDW